MYVWDAGLVLEGGGMRGIFSSGVLNYFMEKEWQFNNIFAVSAGCLNACNYLLGRKNFVYDRLQDDSFVNGFISLKNMRKGNIFDLDRLLPTLYDHEEEKKISGKLYTILTDVKSGEAVCMKINNYKKDKNIILASAAFPYVSAMVSIQGQKFLDGSLTSPVPLKESINKGNKKNLVILTRNRGYCKKRSRIAALLSNRYWQYPELRKNIINRYKNYNNCIRNVLETEKSGNTFIIQPQKPLTVSRMSHDISGMMELYREGYEEARCQYNNILEFLSK